MKQDQNLSLPELCGRISSQTLPRWHELPDLSLYMDQVLGLIDRYLGGYPGFEGKGLTASMVNNYVKLGAMPPPEKRKYTRAHLASLIVICTLKPILPISAIQRLISHELESSGEQEVYDHYCEVFERTGRAAAEAALETPEENTSELSPLYHAALRAQADRALALTLFSYLIPAEQTKKTAGSP